MDNLIQKLKKIYWRKVKLPLYKNKVLLYYNENPDASKYASELDYLKKNQVDSLLGEYLDKYKSIAIDIKLDPENNLPYILHKGHRLYFKRGMKKKDIRIVYKSLISEQDPKSAHCYEGNGFFIQNNDILFDIGAAEGIIGLSAIEKISKLYLFEFDKKWIEALNATFSPWKDKVIIVPKYVTNSDTDNSITIDSFINTINSKPDFIKMDVEGFESKVLEGMKNILSSNKQLKLAVCTYHNFNDSEKFTKILSAQNFKIGYSDGYMLYYNNTKTIKPPYFIKGLIRAEKTIR